MHCHAHYHLKHPLYPESTQTVKQPKPDNEPNLSNTKLNLPCFFFVHIERDNEPRHYKKGNIKDYFLKNM